MTEDYAEELEELHDLEEVEDDACEATAPATGKAWQHGYPYDRKLPRERLCNVHYGDYAADPMTAVEQIYRHFGIEMTGEARSAMQRYTDENPRSARPAHRYDTGSPELITEERRAFARYQSYFGIPSEA